MAFFVSCPCIPVSGFSIRLPVERLGSILAVSGAIWILELDEDGLTMPNHHRRFWSI